MTPLRATYRLQLGPGLGFAQARELVPYLRDLGISHLYLSPSLQARAGSTHGYDWVDPDRISDELGGEDEFRRLAGSGLGVILDIVPNHMGTGDENRFWRDPELRRRFFDIDPATGAHRRFFDIDDLAALTQEDPEVFEATHRKVLELVSEGLVDGIRVDHPDGLADPAGYLHRLRERGVPRLWVEKILHPGEPLREWPVDGTVGYEFLNDVTGLFVDPDGERPLTDLYAEITGERRSFGEVSYEAQFEQATTTFASEVERLRRLADLPGIPEALAALPVYRTYVEPWSGRVEHADREAVVESGMHPDLAEALLLADGAPEEFVTRFQQTSPPVTAKGLEDTALYRYVRLLALNDVGADPSRFSVPLSEFHAGNALRAQRFPEGLLVTQTHDTKRSGDVRARIGALAGMPGEWRERVLLWRRLNAELRLDGAPDQIEEYLIYQTLVGAWPIEVARLESYVEKALREAKRNSSWVDQDHAWEERVKRFCRRLLEHRPFREEFDPFAEKLAVQGESVALRQLLLKLTSPGIPDVYQGDELTCLSLVDPDNRRPVDWQRRREALDGLRAGGAPERDTMKMFLTWRALELRARRPQAFAGDYLPLDAGPGACAHARGGEVIAIAPIRDWRDARLEVPPPLEGTWHDVLSGEAISLRTSVPIAELTGSYGLALLERG